jgi:iron complex transport system substrate-binding protein
LLKKQGSERLSSRIFFSVIRALMSVAKGKDMFTRFSRSVAFVLFAFSIGAIAQTKPIKLTDAAGRVVELAKIPQRLVIVGRAPFIPLHLLYAFPEARRRIVGIENKTTAISDFLPLIDLSFKTKTALSQNPNTEEIASLKPDLVIMKGVSVDKSCESLAKIGIPTLYLALETPEQFFKDTENLGIVLGNLKRAEEILSFYRTRLERLRKGLAGVADQAKPRVLLVEYSNRGGKIAVQVPAKTWMQTLEVQAAGGYPVWFDAVQGTDNYTVVNFEQIARWNPDKIFVVVWYTLDPKKVISDLKSDPQWSALKAVANNEIYGFANDIFGWDTSEPRWILGAEWLATRIHPQRFRDIDLKSEIHSFFGQLYGMSKAGIETGILPTVKMDVH